MIVKAISLWEPWASLMRVGAKTIETRSWSTSYRGPLLICAASRQLGPNERAFLLSEPCFKALAPLRIRIGEPFDRCLSYGKAVCAVDLDGCSRTEDILATPYRSKERQFGDYSPDRYGFITSNLRTFEPFPVTGRQGLFEVVLPNYVAELINGKIL